MIRKILKWIGIVLGSLVGLLVLAFVVLYTIGTVKWNKMHGQYEVSVEAISIPTIKPPSRAASTLQQFACARIATPIIGADNLTACRA